MIKGILSAVLLLALLVGCATGGPPSAFERTLYEVRTNYQTSVVQVVQSDTNKVITNSFWATNVYQVFDLQPRESVEAGIRAGGAIATAFGFGIGGAIATLVLGSYSAYMTWRNAQNAKAGRVLVQNVETGREVIKSVPGGVALDAKFKAQIISQQVSSGVKGLVKKVVDETVNSVAAKAAAENVNRA